jgi:hemin uptake protein HemP
MSAPLPFNPPLPMPAPERPSPSSAASTPPLSSEAVLRGQAAVEIEHNGQIYRLQTTRQGKLILTK